MYLSHETLEHELRSQRTQQQSLRNINIGAVKLPKQFENIINNNKEIDDNIQFGYNLNNNIMNKVRIRDSKYSNTENQNDHDIQIGHPIQGTQGHRQQDQEQENNDPRRGQFKLMASPEKPRYKQLSQDSFLRDNLSDRDQDENEYKDQSFMLVSHDPPQLQHEEQIQQQSKVSIVVNDDIEFRHKHLRLFQILDGVLIIGYDSNSSLRLPPHLCMSFDTLLTKTQLFNWYIKQSKNKLIYSNNSHQSTQTLFDDIMSSSNGQQPNAVRNINKLNQQQFATENDDHKQYELQQQNGSIKTQQNYQNQHDLQCLQKIIHSPLNNKRKEGLGLICKQYDHDQTNK